MKLVEKRKRVSESKCATIIGTASTCMHEAARALGPHQNLSWLELRSHPKLTQIAEALVYVGG